MMHFEVKFLGQLKLLEMFKWRIYFSLEVTRIGLSAIPHLILEDYLGVLTFHIGVAQEEFDFDGDAVPETGFAGLAFYRHLIC